MSKKVMAKIVGVHGINQEYRGSHTIYSEWLPALKDGLDRVGVNLESENDFRCAFYGDLFRGKSKARGLPDYDISDIDPEWEEELLLLWFEALANRDENIQGQKKEVTTKVRFPKTIQKALNALVKSSLFGDVEEKIIIAFLKQVKGYLHNQDLRQKIRERVAQAIDEDTRVLIGHSLGSVVCYELLCQHPEWQIKVFVSLGSPLGIKKLIFDRLDPSPVSGLGKWAGNVEKWINIADEGDIVALEKNLNLLFDGLVEDKIVNNGADAHHAIRYLTAGETGEAIKLGLRS